MPMGPAPSLVMPPSPAMQPHAAPPGGFGALASPPALSPFTQPQFIVQRLRRSSPAGGLQHTRSESNVLLGLRASRGDDSGGDADVSCADEEGSATGGPGSKAAGRSSSSRPGEPSPAGSSSSGGSGSGGSSPASSKRSAERSANPRLMRRGSSSPHLASPSERSPTEPSALRTPPLTHAQPAQPPGSAPSPTASAEGSSGRGRDRVRRPSADDVALQGAVETILPTFERQRCSGEPGSQPGSRSGRASREKAAELLSPRPKTVVETPPKAPATIAPHAAARDAARGAAGGAAGGPLASPSVRLLYTRSHSCPMTRRWSTMPSGFASLSPLAAGSVNPLLPSPTLPDPPHLSPPPPLLSPMPPAPPAAEAGGSTHGGSGTADGAASASPSSSSAPLPSPSAEEPRSPTRRGSLPGESPSTLTPSRLRARARSTAMPSQSPLSRCTSLSRCASLSALPRPGAPSSLDAEQGATSAEPLDAPKPPPEGHSPAAGSAGSASSGGAAVAVAAATCAPVTAAQALARGTTLLDAVSGAPEIGLHEASLPVINRHQPVASGLAARRDEHLASGQGAGSRALAPGGPRNLRGASSMPDLASMGRQTSDSEGSGDGAADIEPMAEPDAALGRGAKATKRYDPNTSQITGFLIDLDGTVYRPNSLIVGACSFHEWLVSTGKQFVYLSNTGAKSSEAVRRKLRTPRYYLATEKLPEQTVWTAAEAQVGRARPAAPRPARASCTATRSSLFRAAAPPQPDAHRRSAPALPPLRRSSSWRTTSPKAPR